MWNKLAQTVIQIQVLLGFKLQFLFFNFYNLSCKKHSYTTSTHRELAGTSLNSLAETTTTTLNSIESSRSLSLVKLFLYCTFCFVEECKCLHRYWFNFGVGFYGARWGSHWNRKRWRIHIWVSFNFKFFWVFLSFMTNLFLENYSPS